MLPELYKKYYCYDDGKISYSRQYQVLVTDIIDYPSISEDLSKLCALALRQYSYLYKLEQKHVVIGVSYEQSIPTISIFLETKGGLWFSIGDKVDDTLDCYWNSGLLDIDGSFTKELEQQKLKHYE